jgi:hypothetical protein
MLFLALGLALGCRPEICRFRCSEREGSSSSQGSYREPRGLIFEKIEVRAAGNAARTHVGRTRVPGRVSRQKGRRWRSKRAVKARFACPHVIARTLGNIGKRIYRTPTYSNTTKFEKPHRDSPQTTRGSSMDKT